MHCRWGFSIQRELINWCTSGREWQDDRSRDRKRQYVEKNSKRSRSIASTKHCNNGLHIRNCIGRFILFYSKHSSNINPGIILAFKLFWLDCSSDILGLAILVLAYWHLRRLFLLHRYIGQRRCVHKNDLCIQPTASGKIFIHHLLVSFQLWFVLAVHAQLVPLRGPCLQAGGNFVEQLHLCA